MSDLNHISEAKTEEDFKQFSMSELVAYFNARSEKSVKKFRDKTQAAKRCAKITKSNVIKTKKKEGIGSFIEECLMNNDSTKDILEKVKDQFPDAKTNNSNISWYRSKLRKLGVLE